MVNSQSKDQKLLSKYRDWVPKTLSTVMEISFSGHLSLLKHVEIQKNHHFAVTLVISNSLHFASCSLKLALSSLIS